VQKKKKECHFHSKRFATDGKENGFLSNEKKQHKLNTRFLRDGYLLYEFLAVDNIDLVRNAVGDLFSGDVEYIGMVSWMGTSINSGDVVGDAKKVSISFTRFLYQEMIYSISVDKSWA